MNRVKVFNKNDLDLSLIKLPEEDCVISKIVAAINMLVERDKMKKLLVIEMNSFLKELGVLSEKIIDGKSPQIFKKYRKDLKEVINTTLYNYIKDAFRIQLNTFTTDYIAFPENQTT